MLTDNLIKNISNSEYKGVWEVLSALMEQDSDLADFVKNLPRIGGERTDKLEIYDKYFSFMRMSNNISDIDLDKLIQAKILEGLLTVWDKKYIELCAFKEKCGDVNVPYNVTYMELATWIRRNRYLYNKKTLSPHKERLLRDLGIEFYEPSPLKDWDDRYKELVEYYNKYKTTLIPTKRGDNISLGKWCSNQRQFFKRGKLAQNQIDLLTQLNFDFTPEESAWKYNYDLLKIYCKNKASKNLEPVKMGRNLSHWCRYQRKAYKKSMLSKEKIKLLKALGFDFSSQVNVISQYAYSRCILNTTNHKKLMEFYKINGHSVVPFSKENYGLYKWISNVRNKREQGFLTTEEIDAMDQLKFVWKIKTSNASETFNAYANLYKEYRAKKLDFTPPLMAWVEKVITAKIRGWLHPYQREVLKEINFSF